MWQGESFLKLTTLGSVFSGILSCTRKTLRFSSNDMQLCYIRWFQVFWTSDWLHFVNCQNLPITSTIKTFRKNKITVEGNYSLNFIGGNHQTFHSKSSKGLLCNQVKVYYGVHIGFLDVIYHQLYVSSIPDEARNQVLISLMLIDAL